MTARTVETTGGRGDGGDGLRRSPMNTLTQAGLGQMMALERPNHLAVEPRRCLPITRSVLEWSGRPTAGAYPRNPGEKEKSNWDKKHLPFSFLWHS